MKICTVILRQLGSDLLTYKWECFLVYYFLLYSLLPSVIDAIDFSFQISSSSAFSAYMIDGFNVPLASYDQCQCFSGWYRCNKCID